MSDPTPDKNQRTVEMKLGDLLVKHGGVKKAKIQDLLDKQLNLKRQGRNVSLGKLVVEEKLLSRDELMGLLKRQAGVKKIAGYEIVNKIGEGGMGAVFKARQVSMDRIVALKILPKRLASNQVFIKRFVREARTAARLNHPNIITAIDVGEESGTYFFAMEFVPGVTVQTLMEQRGPLEENYCAHVINQVSTGLAHATREGIIHRDIKPDNILLTTADHLEDGELPSIGTLDDIVKIADLGLAKFEDEDQTMITQAGSTLGTPHYISPEQALGNEDIDYRCDIYSLGATYYHMLTGRTAFLGKTIGQIVTAHISTPLEDPRELDNNISAATANVIMKMMQKKPENRYQSHAELAADLGRISKGEKVAAKLVTGAADTLIDMPGVEIATATSGTSWLPKLLVAMVLIGGGIAAVMSQSNDDPVVPVNPGPKDPDPVDPNPIGPDKPTAEKLMQRFREETRGLVDQSFSRKISFWTSARTSVQEIDDPAGMPSALSEIESILDNLDQSLAAKLRNANNDIASRIETYAATESWVEGDRLLNGWLEELRKLTAGETLDSSWQPQQVSSQLEFWEAFRERFDEQVDEAFNSRSFENLETMLASLPSEIKGTSQTWPIQKKLTERVEQIKYAVQATDALAASRLEVELLNYWDPLASLEEQAQAISNFQRDALSRLGHIPTKQLRVWPASLTEIGRMISDSQAIDRALVKHLNSLSTRDILQVMPGENKLPPRYNANTRTLTLTRKGSSPLEFSVEGLTPWMLHAMRSSVSKLKDNTAFFNWLIVTRQFETLEAFLNPPADHKGMNKPLPRLAKEARRRMNTQLLLERHPIPHRRTSDGTTEWQTTLSPGSLPKWFLDEPLNSNGRAARALEARDGGLRLKGHALTFLPGLDAKEDWLFSGNFNPVAGEVFEIVIRGDARWVFTIWEGGARVWREDRRIEKKADHHLLRDGLPLEWSISRHGGQVVLNLQGQPVIELKDGFKGTVRCSLVGENWTVNHFRARGHYTAGANQ